jgi:hypothetical protein
MTLSVSKISDYLKGVYKDSCVRRDLLHRNVAGAKRRRQISVIHLFDNFFMQ